MATKLFLRDSTANAIGGFRDMVTTAGAASTTGVVETQASGTEVQWTKTAGGVALEWISGRVPAGGFTLAGTMTFSIWANESNMNANCGARARVYKRSAGGVLSEIGGGPYNDGVEFGTGSAEMVWTGTPTSTAFAEDDRIYVIYFITNIGTMESGHTCTITYDAADATTGDSFFQITENVTFKAESTLSQIAGATTLTFTPSAALTGAGALTGASTLVFSPTSTLTGAASLVGASALTFTPSGVLDGLVALSGATTLAFTPTATLTGSGALVGASSLTFSPVGAFTGGGDGALVGATTLTFAPSGALAGTGALTGASTLTFATSGTFSGALSQITGSASLSFTTGGTLLGLTAALHNFTAIRTNATVTAAHEQLMTRTMPDRLYAMTGGKAGPSATPRDRLHSTAGRG